MSLDRLERPPLISRSVQNAIRDYLITERLKPGDALPGENELARQLGVGRNSVREAVKALESLGILEVRRGSGIYVRDFSFEPILDSLHYVILSDLDDLADIFEVRRIIEDGAIEQAMQSMPEESIVQLRAVVEGMRVQAEQGHPFPDEDRAFHRLLFQHLGNKMLLMLLDTFWLVFRKAALNADLQDARPMHTYRDHAAILAAIEADDVIEAKVSLARHYDGLLGNLRLIESKREEAPE